MSLVSAYYQLMNKFSAMGDTYDQYRPTSALIGPLTASPIGNIKAVFDASLSLAFNAPSKYNNPLFAGIFDPRLVTPGDYLVGPQGTWFIASTEPLKPILCVSCNLTLSITRAAPDQPGPDFYSGENQLQQIVSGYPASLLNGTKGERTEAHLPSDVRDPWVQILMPSPPGAIISAFDQVSDDLGRTFTISAAEQTNLGWRMTAELAEV